MRFRRTLVFAAYLVSIATAQPQSCNRWLLGKLVKGDDQSRMPVNNATVHLEESGGVDVTKDGFFRFCLPKQLESGEEVTISATVADYAIYNPPDGKLRIPRDPDLAHRVEIQILPKGSLKFFSDANLRAFVEHAAHESSKQASPLGSNERPI